MAIPTGFGDGSRVSEGRTSVEARGIPQGSEHEQHRLWELKRIGLTYFGLFGAPEMVVSRHFARVLIVVNC